MDPENNIHLPIIAVNMITSEVLICADSQKSCSTTLNRIRKSTQQDEELNHLSHYITEDFLSDKFNLPSDIQQFWSQKEMLSLESGLITHRERVIVPREMRQEMLQYIHEGHQGKEHCFLRAKDTIF